MEIELTITALSHAGEGIGRHEGRAIFVPFALPGEVVRAEITAQKKNYARARLLDILTASPDRIDPPCPYHFALRPAEADQPVSEACGGCQLQHLAYAAQLEFKRQTLIDQLSRIGGFSDPPVRPALPAASPYGYRNHAQFSLTPEGRLGFQAAGSHSVVAIGECRILNPELAELFPLVDVEAAYAPGLEHVSLRAGADEEPLAVFETADDAPEMELSLPISAALLRPDGFTVVLAGNDYLVETVRGRDFHISAGSFFQVNTGAAEQLVDLVLEALALQLGETVLDLYCGVGLFTAFIAPAAGRVIGVEAYGPAVADAAVNLDEFDNVEIYEAAAEAVLPGLEAPLDAVVLDPPRAGCAPEVAEYLAECGAGRIIYVSCDPATLARDAKRLARGGYVLDWVQPVDMFPQTYHVECVAKFSRPRAAAGE